MAYRDLAAALERIQQLEAELAELRRPRTDCWVLVGARVLAGVGFVAAFVLAACVVR